MHPLIFTPFGNSTGNCILFFGSVHGDELPTAYLMFKLVHYVKDNPAMFKDKCIVIAPLLNPDGFLAASPTRKGEVKLKRVADEKCDTWLRFRTTP